MASYTGTGFVAHPIPRPVVSGDEFLYICRYINRRCRYGMSKLAEEDLTCIYSQLP